MPGDLSLSVGRGGGGGGLARKVNRVLAFRPGQYRPRQRKKIKSRIPTYYLYCKQVGGGDRQREDGFAVDGADEMRLR